MMQTVQLAFDNVALAAVVREALARNCSWSVESVDLPNPSSGCVLVMDDPAFERLSLPLPHPERVVLITRCNMHDVAAKAWDAGIVSVVSAADPVDTVLLAIMAAGLRAGKIPCNAHVSEIPPICSEKAEAIASVNQAFGSNRSKIP